MRGLTLSALRRRRDVWELVASELVRVGADYYRPQPRSIRGREEILAFVAENEYDVLGESIRRAMDGHPRDYIITDGRLRAERTSPPSKPSARTRPRGDNRELARLRSKCEDLETRVASLEATLKRLARASRSGTGSNAPASKSASPKSASPKSASPKSASPKSASASSTPRPRSANPSDSSSASGDKDASSTENDAALTFPDLNALATALSELVGHPVELSAGSDLQPGPGTYCAALSSEGGNDLGSVVVDLAAIIAHGGGLAMLEEEQAQEMADAGAPSADVVDAMGEVISTQIRCFNQVQGNPRVRLEALRPYDESKDAWALDAPRLVTVDSGGGVTLFASK